MGLRFFYGCLRSKLWWFCIFHTCLTHLFMGEWLFFNLFLCTQVRFLWGALLVCIARRALENKDEVNVTTLNILLNAVPFLKNIGGPLGAIWINVDEASSNGERTSTNKFFLVDVLVSLLLWAATAPNEPSAFDMRFQHAVCSKSLFLYLLHDYAIASPEAIQHLIKNNVHIALIQ